MIPLINYLMSVTRQAITHIWESQRFESMYTMQGKPDTHDTYAFHTSPRTSLVRFLQAVPVRGNLSRIHQQSWAGPLLLQKGLSTQSTIQRLTDLRVHIQFLSQGNHWSSGGKANLLLSTSYISLLGPYHQHVLSTFILTRRYQPLGP
jgi:hypothetical protein